MPLPEGLLKDRERIHNFLNASLLDSDSSHHGVGSCSGLVCVRKDRLNPNHFPLELGLFIDGIVVDKLNVASTLLHKENVFCDLSILQDFLVDIVGFLLRELPC
jgi:hypothetical protein